MAHIPKINFKAIVKEYVQTKRRVEGHEHLTHENFDQVRVKSKLYLAEEARSEPPADNGNVQPASTAPQVKVENASGGAKLESEQQLESSMELEILSGTCEDLRHKKVNIDLPYGFGRKEIHLGSGTQQIVQGQIEVKLESSYGTGADARTQASVPTETKQEARTFLRKMYPKGKVLFKGGAGAGEVKTQTIIGHLIQAKSTWVKDFKKDSDGYYWLVEGVCVVSQGVKHGHQWTD